MNRRKLAQKTAPSANDDHSTQPAFQKGVVIGLHIITLLLLALHIYIRTLSPTLEALPTPADAESVWWGLWPVTYLAPFWFWLGVAIIVGTMLWGWLPIRQVRLDALPMRWFYLISALLVVAFYRFPIVHTRWGDAYILSKSIAWPDPALRLTHSWQAPLDVFLHSQVWLAMGEQNGWKDAIPVYHLLSPIAGVLFLIALLQLSAHQKLAPTWFTFGLVITLGLLQLFFGYIENYSFAAAGILFYLWQGHRVIHHPGEHHIKHGRSSLWLAALTLAITNATHPSTIVLGPSLLYLAWLTWKRGTISLWRVVVETALPMLLIGLGTIGLMEIGNHGLAALFTTDRPGGGDASWFVPLWGTQTQWEAYTLLSWPHLQDLLNQMLLVAPVVLPSLLWLIVAVRNNPAIENAEATTELQNRQSETRRFFAIAACFHLLLITLWNPDYGGQRDWDLFSLAWIAPTLLLISVARAKLSTRTLQVGFLPLIVLQALHTAAWVYQNTLPWNWP